MFWADEITKTIKKNDEQLVDDAWSASGFAHVGSLRGLIIHDIANKALLNDGYKSRYTFIIDDFDPMDGLPTYLDAKIYEKEMGKPLFSIESPNKGQSLAEYFAQDFKDTAKRTKTFPEFINNSDLYKSGKLNAVIKEALDNADKIREIYKKVSHAQKAENWYPFQPICEKCGKIGTTTVYEWDGEKVSYHCEESKVDWAKGCGHEGQVSPLNGTGKLYWRVEWPARWKATGITVEGEGKDHWASGGSRDMANVLTREVFNYPSPHDIRYDFFLIGGKKMSSSKGLGVSASEMSEILPPELLRYLMAKNPRKVLEFDPQGNTIPNLYDDYDKAMSAYMGNLEFPDLARAWEIVQESGFEAGYRMRFSKVALSIQMPRIDIFKEAEAEKGKKLTQNEIAQLDERISYAQKWLDKYAPENYVFKIAQEKPAVKLSQNQKVFLTSLLEKYESEIDWTGDDLHGEIHALKSSLEISPKEAFGAIYLTFLNKESGPQAGWLLASLEHGFVTKRLREMVKS